MPDIRRDLLIAAVRSVAASGQFILRTHCSELEAKLSEHNGVDHTVVVSSPSAGLLLLLHAVGIAPADTVSIADSAATYAAGIVRRLGARPVTADAADATWLIEGHTTLRAAGGGATGTVVDLGPRSDWAGIGEAAAVQTGDPDIAARVRMLRNHGQDGRTRFMHHIIGFNARMDEVCAAYLLMRTGGSR